MFFFANKVRAQFPLPQEDEPQAIPVHNELRFNSLPQKVSE